jgi:ligand-binding sensor domain-containing protein
MIAGGGLALGTDTGIFYRGRGSNWSMLGRNLPTTTTMQLKTDPTGRVLYAATHGRGIWSFDLSALRRR